MDPDILSQAIVKYARFFSSACIIVGIVILMAKGGERMIGFNLRKAIDNIEGAADAYLTSKGTFGTPWPITVLILGFLAAVCYVFGGFGH